MIVEMWSRRKWERFFNEVVKVYDSIPIPFYINWRQVVVEKLNWRRVHQTFFYLHDCFNLRKLQYCRHALPLIIITLQNLTPRIWGKIQSQMLSNRCSLFVPRICYKNKHFRHDSNWVRLFFRSVLIIHSIGRYICGNSNWNYQKLPKKMIEIPENINRELELELFIVIHLNL